MRILVTWDRPACEPHLACEAGSFLLALASGACQSVDAQPCEVTLPNGIAPAGEPPSDLYLTQDGLTTVLWPNGIVVLQEGGPGEIWPDGTLVMKFPWWRGEGVVGELELEGHRLDEQAAPLSADIPEGYGNSGFQASALIFPGPGCWQITATSGEAQSTLVTRVVLMDAVP
jgi:hypothetical protein